MKRIIINDEDYQSVAEALLIARVTLIDIAADWPLDETVEPAGAVIKRLIEAQEILGMNQ